MLAPTELARRVRNRLRSKATRLRHRRGWQTLPIGPVRIAPAFRHPIDVAAKASLLYCYRGRFATAAQEELDAAEVLMRHEFSLLGHATRHDGAIRWSLDPVSGSEWPRTFSADIPYRGAQRLGDIKLPWELAKHQYFFTLGKAAWLTGERRFAREIVAQIDHWITENPCHTGIHWISALESGTRALSWILSYPFFAEHCDAAFLQRMVRSIAFRTRTWSAKPRSSQLVRCSSTAATASAGSPPACITSRRRCASRCGTTLSTLSRASPITASSSISTTWSKRRCAQTAAACLQQRCSAWNG
jgi:hypothetical protein